MEFTVTFFKAVPDSTGHMHRTTQAVLRVADQTRDAALAHAKQQFAADHHMPTWTSHADQVMIDAVDTWGERVV